MEQLISHMQVEYLLGNDNAEMLTNVKIGLDYLQEKLLVLEDKQTVDETIEKKKWYQFWK